MLALRAKRPLDTTPLHTEQLPRTPTPDRNIPAEAWIEAPPELLRLGDDLDESAVLYLRQLGPFLLWRAGPGSTRSATRWMAIDLDDHGVRLEFRQHVDGSGAGTGPSGEPHERFRTWKESLHRWRGEAAVDVAGT